MNLGSGFLVGTFLVLLYLGPWSVDLESSRIGLVCSYTWIFREVGHWFSCWMG